MGYIDCDTHVIECEETWDYMDPADREFRPKLVSVAGEDVRPGVGMPFQKLWLLHDTWAPDFPGNGSVRGNGNFFEPGALNAFDLAPRVADLDALGIDVQALYSTMFIVVDIRHARAEAAIKRSWNRWMADRVAGFTDRFVWAAEVPMRSLDRAIEEAEFAAAHGAKAVRLHAAENDLYLDDPYFFPFYERCQDLDLGLMVHVGRPHHYSPTPIRVGAQFPTPAPFVESLANVMTAFWTFYASNLHERFPRLRVLLMEAGSTWTLGLIQQFGRFMASTGDFRIPAPSSERLEERNLFVECQPDEDLALLTEALGENVLVAGTDYGHNDLASDPLAHSVIAARTDISADVARKIVDDNGRKAFGIAPSFRPTGDTRRADEIPNVHAADPSLAVRGVVRVGGPVGLDASDR